MKRNSVKLGIFALLFSAFADSKGEMSHPGVKTVNSGLSGWTGFTGLNANKKKHFNKKYHGKILKRKHRRK